MASHATPSHLLLQTDLRLASPQQLHQPYQQLLRGYGLNVGKERAVAFFQYVSETFSQGLSLTLDCVTSNEKTVVFEFRDEGLMWAQPYKNRVAVSFDVREDKICGYREYFGSDGKSN